MALQGLLLCIWADLLVEKKSRGKNLDHALTQALSYFPGLAERDFPQIVIVCDFARFRVHRLATGETIANDILKVQETTPWLKLQKQAKAD